VPVYPSYVIAILASILLTRPVKWIEDNTGNLISTGYARDMYFHCDAAIRKDGKIQAVRVHADHRQRWVLLGPRSRRKFKIGLFHSIFGCYDVPYGYLTAQGHYTNKAPVASPTGARSASPSRCSSRSGSCRPAPTRSGWTRPSSAG